MFRQQAGEIAEYRGLAATGLRRHGFDRVIWLTAIPQAIEVATHVLCLLRLRLATSQKTRIFETGNDLAVSLSTCPRIAVLDRLEVVEEALVVVIP